MANKIRIRMKPGDGSQAHCNLFLMSHNRATGEDTKHVVFPTGEAPSGIFNFESKAKLKSGTYYLQLKVTGVERSATATVEGEPTILSPFEAEWPLSVEVPSTAAHKSDDYAFEHGG